VSGTTLGSHQLEGVRIWSASSNGPGQIAITTEAYEVPRGLMNEIGALVFNARSDQETIWNTYLANLAAAIGAHVDSTSSHAGTTPAGVNPFGRFMTEP
jgi:hypothetical protein